MTDMLDDPAAMNPAERQREIALNGACERILQADAARIPHLARFSENPPQV